MNLKHVPILLASAVIDLFAVNGWLEEERKETIDEQRYYVVRRRCDRCHRWFNHRLPIPLRMGKRDRICDNCVSE